MEFDLNQALEILRRTPDTLRSLLSGLSDPWITGNEGADTFSPYDVVGHLIHGEETDWIPRAKIILEHGEALAFEPFDRLAFFERSEGKTLGELLDTFETLRRRNLQVIDALKLNSEQMEKRGTHPELGPVTLGQLIASWVVHDLAHLGQVARVMAKQYNHAVGPWKAYLPILMR